MSVVSAPVQSTAAGEAVGIRASRWIVSPGYDAFYFIGSCVWTLVFFGLYRLAGSWSFAPLDDILITYFLFTALFDHPHIFQTFSRTHADREQFTKHRFLFTWGLVLFILAGFVIVGLGGEGPLIAFAALYGTWHIIRQNYGLMRAYKIVNEDLDPVDNWLDGLTFYVGMFAGFFNDYSGFKGHSVIYGDLSVKFPSLPSGTGEMAWNFFLILLIAFGFRQTWRVMMGRRVNLPKIAFLAAVLSTHYFVFFATATPFLVAEALETVTHNVQYQGWVRLYQKKRFSAGVLKPWLIASLVYGLIVGVIEIFGLLRVEWAIWLFTPFAMMVLYHYYTDGLIWRFRESPELRQMLVPGK